MFTHACLCWQVIIFLWTCHTEGFDKLCVDKSLTDGIYVGGRHSPSQGAAARAVSAAVIAGSPDVAVAVASPAVAAAVAFGGDVSPIVRPPFVGGDLFVRCGLLRPILAVSDLDEDAHHEH